MLANQQKFTDRFLIKLTDIVLWTQKKSAKGFKKRIFARNISRKSKLQHSSFHPSYTSVV